MLRLLLTIFFTLASLTKANALDEQSFDQLRQLMIDGCSLGMELEVRTTGDGNISIFRKGLSGEFSFSKREMPAIVSKMEQDVEKRKIASDTRNCMEGFMNRLFDAVLSAAEPRFLPKNPKVLSDPQSSDLQIALDSAISLSFPPKQQEQITKVAVAAMCKGNYPLAEEAIGHITFPPDKEQLVLQLIEFLLCARQFSSALRIAKQLDFPPKREENLMKISTAASGSNSNTCDSSAAPLSLCSNQY